MRVDLAGAIVVTALFWVIAWAGVTTRNVRLFVVLALLSLAIIGGALGPGRIGLVIEVAAGISAAVVIIRPERFGLGSLDSIDYQANATLRTLASALEGAEPESNALRSLASLHSPPFTTASSPWRHVGRCYGVVLARLGDPDAGRAPDRTPLLAFRRAALHFWQLALDWRVIGRPHRPGAWDEDVLLRCFHDEFDRLIPPGSSIGERFSGHDGWDAMAQRHIEELEALPLFHAMPLANRRLLSDGMRARLTVALGDRSETAVARMEATATAISVQWQAPEEDVRS